MRVLTGLVLVLALLWSGYWVVGRTGVVRGAEALQTEMAQEGVTVAWEELRVRGFPSRFDTILDAPRFEDPEAGIAWGAPFLQVMALSYRPNEVIAAFAPEQRVETPAGEVLITSEGMRASAGVRAALDVPLDHATLEAAWLELAAGPGLGGWQARAEDLLFAFREGAGAEELPGAPPAAYDVYLRAAPVTLPAALSARVDPEGRLPDQIASLTADLTLGLSGPIAARASAEPELEAVQIRAAEVVWGDMALAADGAVTIREDGRPEGRLELTVSNWPLALDLAADAGLVEERLLSTWRAAARALAQGDESELTVPLVFTDGRMSIGPLPAFAPAPVLVRRD
ncbi:DUF2125 domain-containing protein [Pseudoroseicyclus tamaricis]|uniref:DUF2125 domain-containing protein n=1 Tax=Pseudoroseicyclus tamaricis TaxID=2705421 RepID=A0A6B2K0S4_9RHOB|nr:DUF2125 domain-containing protein [Pseudoroseicyclus tamaricis]NDU99915.1 DUF2125 domain-containing protein [Pseudoroseicyclus tamaricis]